MKLRRTLLPALAAWVAPGAVHAASGDDARWQNTQTLVEIVHLLELRHYPGIQPEPLRRSLLARGRGVAGVDPVEFDRCTAKDAGPAKGTDLMKTAAKVAGCIGLDARAGNDRYLAFSALAEAIFKPLDDGSGPVLPAMFEPLHSSEPRGDAAPLIPQALTAAGGVGLTIGDAPNGKEVVRTTANSPARAAMIGPNDVIVAIDGKPTADMATEEAVAALRGAPDSAVSIEVVDKDGVRHEHRLRRKSVEELHQVLTAVRRGPALVIRVHEFSSDVASRLTEVLKGDLKQVRALVIDLRDNPGGTLEDSVDFADVLLGASKIGSVVGRTSEDSQLYWSTPKATAKDLPLAVIINSQTAAGSEIVAAALADNNRAILVGERTFGRGSIQSLYMLGTSFGVKVTTGEFLRANGDHFHKLGIDPDCRAPTEDQQVVDLAIALALGGARNCPGTSEMIAG